MHHLSQPMHGLCFVAHLPGAEEVDLPINAYRRTSCPGRSFSLPPGLYIILRRLSRVARTADSGIGMRYAPQKHVSAKSEQPDEEPAAKDSRLETPSHELPGVHSGQRRQQREER